MPFSTALHALAAAIWVGGMFFAYVVVRPSVAELALAPWRRYRLGTIRLVVATDLALGPLTIAIGASGRHWG